MALRMLQGVRPEQAATQLQSVAQRAKNLASGSAGRDLPLCQNDYLQWVNEAELHLRAIFIEPTTWQGLYTDAHWHARRLGASSPRWGELLNTELEAQAIRLTDLSGRLQRFADHLTAAPGTFVLLDTNVLLHFQPPEQVDWVTVTDLEAIRLVLPLRVIEELDEKKYLARPKIADRARRLLSQLRERLNADEGTPAQLRDGVTIEVPVDDEPRQRRLDADQEILETARDLQWAGASVVLVTDDTGMHIRARAMELRVVDMPEQYLRQQVQAEGEDTE